VSHFHTDLAVEDLPRRDLASADIWERSLTRSLYRREQAALGRKELTRKKGASVAMSAAMLGATAAPSVVAAQSSSGGGSPSSAAVEPTALTDPGESIMLKLGDSGPAVAAVQRELAIQVDPAVEVDGVYGPQTQAGVVEFQRAEGLRVDGVVGPNTWAALFDGRNVAFVPSAPAPEVAASPERPTAPTRPASLTTNARPADSGDFNGGNYLVMVQNKRSSGASDAGGGGASPGNGSTAGGNSSPGGNGSTPVGNPSPGGQPSPGNGGSNGGGSAGGVTVCGLEKLRWPTEGHNLTSTFGDGRNHGGIDISYAGIDGDPVRAAACGQISFAGYQDGYGNIVCIKHTPRFETCYAHLSSIKYDSGYVKTGQIIGRVGNTGNSTGPHLHFETRVRGNAKDPLPYLRGDKKVPGKNKRYEREQRREQRQREQRRAEREQQEQQPGTDGSEDTNRVSGEATYATQTEPAPTPAESSAPAPVEEAPVEPAPAPVEPAPVEEAPAPVEEAPAPVEPAPVEPAPVEPAPVEPAPVEEVPAPVEPAPAPVEPAPVEPAPVEPAPAPVEEAPVAEAPVEPAPVEPAPVEEAPVPVEPAPVEPAPVEPAPVEEAPVDPVTGEVVPAP